MAMASVPLWPPFGQDICCLNGLRKLDWPNATDATHGKSHQVSNVFVAPLLQSSFDLLITFDHV
jgi:hypothetical protein